MSYQVLARKWRPKSFAEMVGQEHVLRALINGLDNDRLHHAYLFTGTRGVGKTTIARILAKCFNCELGVSSVPCGECGSCREIAEGRFVDLIEVDAASRTKVEDTRELLDNVQYLPTRGRYKVYLIDEVHMLTNHSFNALLKTLEEPPPHVKFLLATTDPQKLPVTVLSRCLQFNLKNLGPERIVGHLKFVLGEEKIPFEESALWELGRAADGSMRDALSLTDQAIAHGGGTLNAAEVNAMLGTIDRSAVVEICQAVAAGDAVELLAKVDKLADHAPDYSAALADMLTLWHQVAIAQAMPGALDPVQEHHSVILQLAECISREDVQLFYQMTLLGRKDLPHAADPRSGFEMVLLRLLAFRPLLPDQTEAPPAQRREAAVPAKKSESGPVAPVGASPPSSPVAARVQSRITGQSQPAKEAEQAWKTGSEEVAATGSGENRLSAEIVPIRRDIQPAPVDAGEKIPELAAPPQIAGDDELPPPWLDNYPVEEEEPVSPGRYELPDIVEYQVVEDSVNEVGATGEAMPSAELPSLDGTEKVSLSALAPQTWIQVCQGLGAGGLIQNIAANMQLEAVANNQLVFVLDKDNSALYDESHQQRLQQDLSRYFGEPVSIQVRIAAVSAETPRMTAARIKAERQQQALDLLKADANVRELCRVFAAELVESTVRPVE